MSERRGRTVVSGMGSRSLIAVAAVAAVSLAVAPGAGAAFGDTFGVSPINGHPGSVQNAPAIPETNHAFWAMACDRTTAPAFGQAIAAPGIGTYPAAVISPSGTTTPPRPVPAPVVPTHCMEWGAPSLNGRAPWAHAPSWRLGAASQAGGHPDGTSGFALDRVPDGLTIEGSLDNIVVDLPPGLVGDPTAVPKCTADQFSRRPLQCPPQTQLGTLSLEIQAAPFSGNLPSASERIYPVYNIEPRKGNVAELGFGYASGETAVSVRLVAKARTNSDFGVTAFVGQIPAALQVRSQQITLWGIPWDRANDVWRAPTNLQPGAVGCNANPGVSGVDTYLPPSGMTTAGCPQKYDPSWGPVKPFFSNLTECSGGGLSTRMAIDEFQQPGSYTPEGDPVLPPFPDLPAPGSTNWRVYSFPAPAMQRCDAVPFDATMDLQPTASAADSASGLSVDLGVPQEINTPPAAPAPGATQPEIDSYLASAAAHWKSDQGLATSQLDKSVVTLPEGFSVNPSAASGLSGCSDEGVGVRAQGNPPLFNNGDPFDSDPSDGAECPLASIIGDVRVDVPLLDEPLHGKVVLGNPKSTDPTSGEMLRMFIVVKDDDRGLIAKVYGSAVADPNTGRLTATFDKNPRVPFENLHIDFKQGPRGVLATPQRCNTEPDQYRSVSSFTPWSRSHLPEGDGPGTQDPVDITQNRVVDQNCAYAFNPALNAGMSNATARKSGAFSFEFTRPQGDQTLKGLTAELPTGLLASVKDLPLCSNAQANAGNCPAASRIGLVDASAGSGDPFVLEQKGDIYLTEGYKGGPYGLMVKVRAIAGPFRDAMELSPIIVRQKIEVDPTTAQVKAISDPFPTIWHGVPLRVRRVLVKVDRPNFMINPSDCSPKQIKANLTSTDGTAADPINPFQASGCAALAFKPKLGLRLTGPRQISTGKHPGIRAVVTQNGVGEAGIQRAEVRLPKSLALDVNNAQALCEYTDGTKPDLENHCPKGSIVGRAKATSPLLNNPLAGNVYFVKNVRRSSSGNLIRTLPMIVVALRGEIAINLKGESNTTKTGKLVNTFNQVPDAPVSKFNLNIQGGRNGILAVTRTRRNLINLCANPRGHTAEADIDGHNGRHHDRNITMKTPCARRTSKKAKAQKRKTAANHKRTANRKNSGR